MHIIIAGAGQVGRRVTEELTDRGHDVITIDKDEKACDIISMRTGARVIQGDASKIDVLKKARIDKADVCIGLIGRDSANLAFTLLASSFKVPNILVRMIDPSYKEAYIEAGADRALNTVEIYMDSLIMEIERPSIKRVAKLGAGDASIVIIDIPKDSPIKDKKISEIITREDFPTNVVFAGIYRENEFIVPRGNEKIKTKDKVFLTGNSEAIREAAEEMGVE